MEDRTFNKISIVIIIGLIIVFICASFTTWDGYFLHPNCDIFSTKTNYIEIYHGWDEYERDNVSYNPSCYMGISSVSNDGFLVGNEIDINIYTGFVEFDKDVVGNIKNVNVTILFNPPIIDKDGKSIFMIQSLTTVHDYKRWFEFSYLASDIHYNVSGSKRIGARAQISDENGSYNISFDYEIFIDIEPAYLTTQLKLTKAVVILAYWTVFFSLVMALDKIINLFKGIKNSNNKNIKNNGEIDRNMELAWWREIILHHGFKIAKYGFLLGFIFLFVGFLDVSSNLFFTLGFGIFTLIFGILSLRFYLESDILLTSIAELDFLEKNAMMHGYISELLKDDEKKMFHFYMRIVKDLHSGFRVVKWVKNKEIKEIYAKTFNDLIQLIEKKSIIKSNEELRLEFEKLKKDVDRFKK